MLVDLNSSRIAGVTFLGRDDCGTALCAGKEAMPSMGGVRSELARPKVPGSCCWSKEGRAVCIERAVVVGCSSVLVCCCCCYCYCLLLARRGG